MNLVSIWDSTSSNKCVTVFSGCNLRLFEFLVHVLVTTLQLFRDLNIVSSKLNFTFMIPSFISHHAFTPHTNPSFIYAAFKLLLIIHFWPNYMYQRK